MQNGVQLGMVAWLKCCKVTMLVGDHGLEAGTPEQFSVHVSLGDLCADEREQLLFVLLIFQESAVPVTLRNWSPAIADIVRWLFPRRCCVRALRLFSSE